MTPGKIIKQLSVFCWNDMMKEIYIMKITQELANMYGYVQDHESPERKKEGEEEWDIFH